jgi:hypothetical protein
MLDGLPTSQSVTMTDSYTNSYTRLGTANIANIGQVDVWIGKVTTSGPSFTVTASNLGNTTASIIAEEWNGALYAVDVTKSATDNSGSSTSISTGASASTNYSEAIVFVAAAINSSSTTYTVGSGYSNLTSVVSSPSKLATESKTISVAGAQTGTFTISAGQQWVTVLVVVPQAGGSFGRQIGSVGGMSRSEVAN